MKKLTEGLQFYQDKLHEETVFARFNEILAKARANKANKTDSDLKEFEGVSHKLYYPELSLNCSSVRFSKSIGNKVRRITH